MRADPLDAAFRALADRTRRGVVELLQQRPHRAGELAATLDVSAPALTRHLRILRASELVEEGTDDGDGRVRLYRLRPELFGRLRTWVDAVEAMWAAQLASFARHVEGTARQLTTKDATAKPVTAKPAPTKPATAQRARPRGRARA